MGRFSKLETHDSAPSAEVAAQEEVVAGAEPITFVGVMSAGDDFFYKGEFKKALRHYSRALQMDNLQVTPWVGQVLSLLFHSQLSEAGVWAQRALTCFPEDPVMLSLHGLTLSMQGTVKRGLATSDFAMSKGSTDLMNWVSRGWILLEADNANWEFCFVKVAELCPPNGWRVHMLMGMILERYKKWSQALEHYKRAVEMQTANFYLWARLGHCYGKLGLTRKAVEAQQQALQLNPRCAEAERQLTHHVNWPIGGFVTRVLRVLRSFSVKKAS